jgi:hypothetical protein
MAHVPLAPSLTRATAPFAPIDRRGITGRRPWTVLDGRGGARRSAGKTLVVGPASERRRNVVPGATDPDVLLEPCDLGTGATALRAAHWIHWRDPDGTLAFFSGTQEPRDVAPSLAAAATFLRIHPRWSVLLTTPERGRGGRDWIEPGEPLGVGAGVPLWRVRRLRGGNEEGVGGPEDACVVVARAGAIVALGERCLPELSDALAQLARFAGPLGDSWLLRQAYASARRSDFFRDVLPGGLPFVAVGWLGESAGGARTRPKEDEGDRHDG